jgi:hypothetical protein
MSYGLQVDVSTLYVDEHTKPIFLSVEMTDKKAMKTYLVGIMAEAHG